MRQTLSDQDTSWDDPGDNRMLGFGRVGDNFIARIWAWWLGVSVPPSSSLLTPRNRARLWKSNFLARTLAALLLGNVIVLGLVPAAPVAMTILISALSSVYIVAAVLNRRGYVDVGGILVSLLFILVLTYNIWMYSEGVGGLSWIASQALDLYAVPVVISSLAVRRRFTWLLVCPLCLLACLILVVFLPEAPDLLRTAVAVHDIPASANASAQQLYLHLLLLVRPYGLIIVVGIIGSFAGRSMLLALEGIDRQSGLARQRQAFADELLRQQRQFTALLAAVEHALSHGEELELPPRAETDAEWGSELQTQFELVLNTLRRLQRALVEAREGWQARAAWNTALATWGELPGRVEHVRSVGILAFGESVLAGEFETVYAGANLALQTLAEYERYQEREIVRGIEAVESTIDWFMEGNAQARVHDSLQGSELWRVALKVNVLLDHVQMVQGARTRQGTWHLLGTGDERNMADGDVG